MKHRTATRWGAAIAALALALLAPATPALAARPDGVSGPVIHHEGNWYLRTTPTSGPATASFRYGNSSDLPVVGDWDGNGSESVGVVRVGANGALQWLLRNTNSGGNADTSFTFGTQRIVSPDRLGSIPVAGNFDPADDAYEVGVVYVDDANGVLSWDIRTDLTPASPTVTFTYGRASDWPVVGDWNGDGTDTAGVVRSPNRWLLINAARSGGIADLNFTFGAGNASIRDLPVPGDWNGDGTDTPGVVRNNPPTQTAGGYEVWLTRDDNSTGAADSTFTFGNDTFAPDLPLETIPRLAVEVT